jgi:hypothetical protein
LSSSVLVRAASVMGVLVTPLVLVVLVLVCAWSGVAKTTAVPATMNN